VNLIDNSLNIKYNGLRG